MTTDPISSQGRLAFTAKPVLTSVIRRLGLMMLMIGLAWGLQAQSDPGHLIHLQGYPDFTVAQQLDSKEAKGRYVFEQLQGFAREHEALLAGLDDAGAEVVPYWMAGVLHVRGLSAAKLERLQSHPQVAAVHRRSAESFSFKELLPEPAAAGEASSLQSRNVLPEWGIRFMEVEQVWEQGIMGQEVVIGGQDTGYEWLHQALTGTYRGNKGDSIVHHYSWHDAIKRPVPATADSLNPCGYDLQEPCDDNGHGTHTMGTMAGTTTDGGPVIGVAPMASWIGCRNMDRGNGTELTYLDCFSWFLAPTKLDGSEPRPDLAPDVINNSWTCPPSEGCDSSTYVMYERSIAALRAAGIVIVASAGNSGRRGCATVANVPVIAPGTLIVGAHDSLGRIAAFSSRGLENGLGHTALAPMIAAPGVNVRSSLGRTGYANLSGTSMAGPHVAAVVALIISANPSLRGQVDEIEAIIQRSATPQMPPVEDVCTFDPNQVPNPVFGYGWINARRAVEEAMTFVSSSQEAKASFFIGPNPVDGSLSIRLDAAFLGAQLEVYDLAGRKVLSMPLNEQSLELSGIDWPAGMYFYSLQNDQSLHSGKLVKR